MKINKNYLRYDILTVTG